MAWVKSKEVKQEAPQQLAPAPVVAPVVQQPVQQHVEQPMFDVGTIATQTEVVPIRNGEQIDILKLLVEMANDLKDIKKSISG